MFFIGADCVKGASGAAVTRAGERWSGIMVVFEEDFY